MIKILIADDHAIMREGLKKILEEVPDFDIVGEAVNGHAVIDHIRRGGFDLLLLDMSMPGRQGLDLIQQVTAEAPKIAVLVLTMHGDSQFAVRAIRAGARGYMTKDSAGTQLVSAIRRVASGRPYFSMEVAEQLAMHITSFDGGPLHKRLSDREYQVFLMLVSGKSNTEISETLALSIKTISSHKSNIQEKMGLNSMSALVQYAVGHQLIAQMET